MIRQNFNRQERESKFIRRSATEIGLLTIGVLGLIWSLSTLPDKNEDNPTTLELQTPSAE